MNHQKKFAGLLFVVLNLVGPVLHGKTSAYAIVIGNNAPPANSTLSRLRYADDDAIRYYRFFKLFSNSVHLLTVPDNKTQARYPDIVNAAEVPSLANLDLVVDKIKKQVATDESKGKRTVVYIAFSGHGRYDDTGSPSLVFRDGGLTSDGLQKILSTLNSDFVHLLLDACYAAGVVGARGMFDNELESYHVQVLKDRVNETMENSVLARFPGLGFVISSSENDKTHEWSQIESGVFTHEVLSGLTGAADVNLDGRVEYSELAAFVSVANREVKDKRGKINIIARPPLRNRNIAIVDFGTMSDVVLLSGNPSKLGHFFVELENGERYADANLNDMNHMHMVIPRRGKAFLHTKNAEAPLYLKHRRALHLSEVTFSPPSLIKKGFVEDAFRDGLFNAGYGRRYYMGFVDSIDLSTVDFSVPRYEIEQPDMSHNRPNLRYRTPLAISLLAFSAISAGTAVGFGVLSINAKNEYKQTELQVPSMNASEKYRGYTTGFWISVGTMSAALVAGLLFLPREKETKNKKILSKRFYIDSYSAGIVF